MLTYCSGSHSGGYFGVCGVETFLFDAETRHPASVASVKAVGAGSLFALAPGRGLLAHREGGGTPHTYAQLKKPQEWFTDFGTTDAAALTARVAKEFDGWAPALTAPISDSNTPPAYAPSSHCRLDTAGTACPE